MDFEDLGKKVENLTKIAEKLASQNASLQLSNSLFLQQLSANLILRTYSVSEAHKETGLGTTRMLQAIKSGKLPFIRDGKAYRIKHTDLLHYINSIKTN